MSSLSNITSLSSAVYDGNLPVHPSKGGLFLSGLDATSYYEFFDHGIQTICAAGDKCMANACADIKASTHNCMGCSLYIHSALMCGKLFDEWWQENNTKGFLPSMLPPYGQGKYKDYADRLGETGLYICHCCIDKINAKMLMISSPPSSPNVVVTSNSRFVTGRPTPSPPTVVVVGPLDSDTQATFFTDGKQTRCAAGVHCSVPNARLSFVNDSWFCIVCKLSIHNPETCGVRYGKWVASKRKSTGLTLDVINSVMPDYAMANVVVGSDIICASCIIKIEAAVGQLTGGSDGCPSTNASKTTGKHISGTTIDWKEYRKTVTWENIAVTASATHPVFKTKNSVMTQLQGFTVGDTIVATCDIDIDTIRALARVKSIKAIAAGSFAKPVVAKALADLRIKKDEEASQGLVVPDNIEYNDDDRLLWNIVRFINIVFSTDFKDRFVGRGKSLTKDQLDAGELSDQQLFTDFLIAYNVSTKYGEIAFDNSASVTTNPSTFRPIPTTEWQKAKKRFFQLMKAYEDVIKHMRKSGTHAGFLPSLEEIVLSKEKSTTPLMIYLHQHMQKNKDMLEPCIGFLPGGVAFESTPGGALNSATANAGGSKRGGGRISVSRTKKTARSWLKEKAEMHNEYVDALVSKVAASGEKFDMETRKLELDAEKTKLEIDILSTNKDRETADYHAKMKDTNITKRRALKKNIEERYGGTEGAIRAIKVARDKREAEKNQGVQCAYSLSQDSLVGQYLDCGDAIVEADSNLKKAKKKIADSMKAAPSERENAEV